MRNKGCYGGNICRHEREERCRTQLTQLPWNGRVRPRSRAIGNTLTSSSSKPTRPLRSPEPTCRCWLASHTPRVISMSPSRAGSAPMRQACRLAIGSAAAGAAVRVAMHLLFDTALLAPVRGWLARAERLLDGRCRDSGARLGCRGAQLRTTAVRRLRQLLVTGLAGPSTSVHRSRSGSSRPRSRGRGSDPDPSRRRHTGPRTAE